MKILKNIKIYAGALILFCGGALADDKTKLEQAFLEFSNLVKAGDIAASLPYSQKVYELSQSVYDETHTSRISAAENYGYILKLVGKDLESEVVLLDLLELKENKFGRYDKELIPVLSDLSSLKLSKNKISIYKNRYEKLYLRHNSSQFVSQLTASNISRDPFADEIKEKLIDELKVEVEVYESEHWTLLMVGKSKKLAKTTGELLEKINKSMLSFRIALDIPPPAREKRMIAVYFESQEQKDSFKLEDINIIKATNKYTYHNSFGNSYNPAISKHLSISSPRWKLGSFFSMYLNKKGKAYPKWKIIERSTQYMAWNTGLKVNIEGGSPWLYWGLYHSFFHQNEKKEFGPHTENYSFGAIKKIKNIIAKYSAPSVKIIVAPTESWREKDKRTIQFDVILLQYLYTYYPEELAQHFIDSRTLNSNGSNVSLRVRFEKAFGDIEKHEAPFSQFLQEVIDKADAQQQNK